MDQKVTLEIRWSSFSNSKVLIELPDSSPAIEIINLSYSQREIDIQDNFRDKESNDPNKSNILPILIHNGKILNPSLTLKFQNVCNNDTIIIYEKKKQFDESSEKIQTTSNRFNQLLNENDDTINENFNQSLMHEALFHRDKYYQNLEMDKKALFTYHQLLEAHQITGQTWKQQLQNQLQQHPQQYIQFVFQMGDDSNDFFLDIFGFCFNNNYIYNPLQNKILQTDLPTKIPKKRKKPSVKPLPSLLPYHEDFFAFSNPNGDVFNCNQNQNKGDVVPSIDSAQKCLSDHSCNWKW